MDLGIAHDIGHARSSASGHRSPGGSSGRPASRHNAPPAPRPPAAPRLRAPWATRRWQDGGYRRQAARPARPGNSRPASPCSGCRCGYDRKSRHRVSDGASARSTGGRGKAAGARSRFSRRHHRRGRFRISGGEQVMPGADIAAGSGCAPSGLISLLAATPAHCDPADRSRPHFQPGRLLARHRQARQQEDIANSPASTSQDGHERQ